MRGCKSEGALRQKRKALDNEFIQTIVISPLSTHAYRALLMMHNTRLKNLLTLVGVTTPAI